MIRHLLILSCMVAVSLSLSGRGKQDITVSVAKYRGDKACAVSYTFDDGLAEHYTAAAPQLEKRGFRGTFWVWGKCINENTQSVPYDTTRMTWPQLKEMAAAGHEISSHSWSHQNLPKIPIEDVKIEIERNDSIFLAKLGFRPLTFCYPFNARTDEIVAMASEGRVDTRTRQVAVGSRSTVESLDRWVDKLIADGDWGVGMTHGINYGYDAFPDATVLWQHFDRVKMREDSVWVGTFVEVAAYIKERENISLKTTGRGGNLEITPTLLLDGKIFTESLTMVIGGENITSVEARQDGKPLPVSILGGKALFDFNPYGGPIRLKVR